MAQLRYAGAAASGAGSSFADEIRKLERDMLLYAKRQRLARWKDTKRFDQPRVVRTEEARSSNEDGMSKKVEGLQGQMDQIKRLQDEISSLQMGARDELIAQANQVIQDLNRMGFDYRLVQGGGRGRTAGKATRYSDPNRPCPVCKFRTVPFHDARTHRSQGTNKKAFTTEELRELSLKRV